MTIPGISDARRIINVGQKIGRKVATELQELRPSNTQSGKPGSVDRSSVGTSDQKNLEKVRQAAKDGDYKKAIETGLNSEGDSVELEIGVNASLPIVVPGTKLGGDASVSAEVARTGDGYEVSLSAQEALELGLEVDDDLNAQIEAGLEVELTYQYDTLEEATQGVKDLAITAGNHPAVDEAAALLENAADLANDAANSRIGNITTDVIGLAVGGPIFGRQAGDFINGQVTDLTGRAEAKTNEFKTAVDGAQTRLNDAYDSVTISGSVGASANLGLPTPVDVKGLKLGVEVKAEQEFSTTINKDGTASVDLTYSADVNGAAELGATAGGTASASVTVSQDLKKSDNGFYERDGSAEVEFSTDLSGNVGAAAVVGGSGGLGISSSYTFEVDQVSNQIDDAATQFLQGNTNGAIDELGDIEVDAKIQTRATASVEFEAGAGAAGANINVSGALTYTDQHDPLLDVDNTTLKKAAAELKQATANFAEEHADALVRQA
ncbi:MAG: hypothetical protein ACRBM6_22215 [Geminicoccales bacterium]